MNLIEMNNVTYTYPNENKNALYNINLEVREGEFLLITGRSGSGKSTLGKLIKGIVPEFYGGTISGKFICKEDVGIVFQDPEKQIFMDTVEREIVFGMENMGLDNYHMKKTTTEIISFLNMDEYKSNKTINLSGGQKQKVAIGATLAMGSRIIVFDEPISQLDPSSAWEVLEVIKRLNEDMGYTIILIEQRLEKCLGMVDRVVFMDEGKVYYDGYPNKFSPRMDKKIENVFPSTSTIYEKVIKEYGNRGEELPISIKEGKKLLQSVFGEQRKKAEQEGNLSNLDNLKYVARLKNISFKYPKSKFSIKNLSLNIEKNKIIGIIGENGGGKSTILKIISGLIKPDSGKVFCDSTIGFLSQNPNDYLFNDTVFEEILFTMKQLERVDYKLIYEILDFLDLSEKRDANPRNLSGGERQRVAIASVLAKSPGILILDEPTRGLDKTLKEKLSLYLKDLRNKGMTIILVSHDIDFLGDTVDDICLISQGEVQVYCDKYNIISDGIFYSTSVSKLFSNYKNSGDENRILSYEDAIKFIGNFQKRREVFNEL